MKNYILQLSAFLLLCMATSGALAQVNKENTYTLLKLSQEPVKKGKAPQANDIKVKGDTTFTVYKNTTVPLSTYFVDGEQYHPLFNPNPTGIILNNQYFLFYCDVEKAFRQSVSNLLDIYEFSYLGKQYLVTLTMREDCAGKSCAFRCYNLFDISNPKRIFQTSFSSIFEGSESFGDFNMDGQIDFVRAIPKAPENLTTGTSLKGLNTYLITAFTIDGSRTVQLRNEQNMANYIFAKGDAEVREFSLIQHDWMIPLKDAEGNIAKAVTYYQPYTPFDPKDSHMYDINGARVEKNRWSLMVGEFGDLEGAQQFCEELSSRKFENIFIMTDQYSRDITFQVMVGNYLGKEQAKKDIEILKSLGFETKFRNLKSAY